MKRVFDARGRLAIEIDKERVYQAIGYSVSHQSG
jgi:hypothetical protein